MDRLNRVKVTKTELKKSGTGQYGPWELFRIEIDDPDWNGQHFSYFAGGDKKPELKVGQELDFIEFETKQDGQYTNYQINKVGFEEDKPKPTPAASGGGEGGRAPRNEKAMFYAYAKDLAVAGIKGQVDPERMVALVTYMAETLYKASQGDAKTMARLRDVYLASRSTSPEGGSSSTSDPRKPDEKDEFDPQMWVAEEAHHCAVIDSLPHLENWWKKICPSTERKAAEEAGYWKGLSDVYTERKKQLKDEFKASKEAEETEKGDDVGDPEEEIPF